MDKKVKKGLIVNFSLYKVENGDGKSQYLKSFLVPFLATKEAMAPLANYFIILGRLILYLSHLEYKSLSIISETLGRKRML